MDAQRQRPLVDPHMEGDEQDVFIESLLLAADGKHLAIVNACGQRFEPGLDGCAARAALSAGA